MKIETLVTGAFEVNCYIATKDVHNAFVVDPGADADAILSALRDAHLTVAAYLLTHGHADHTGALAEVCAAFPAPIHIAPADEAWAFTPANQIPPFYGAPARPQAPVLQVSDGQEIHIAGCCCRVIATPGHTPGGVCYYFEDEAVLFAGDTLFRGSVGRTDIRGGDPRTLAKSLAILARLPGPTRVYPGHGPATTIAQEKATNFFLRGARES